MHTKTKSLISRGTSKQVREDETVLMGKTEYGYTFEYSEDILQAALVNFPAKLSGQNLPRGRLPTRT